VSSRLQGFLDKMLVRDPAQRATAAELLHHPFLRQAAEAHVLVPLMRQFRNSPTWYVAMLARLWWPRNRKEEEEEEEEEEEGNQPDEDK